mmetsp:Transcript_83877/g.234067  ORF Transcript_83877/g.234067 Transcript_83877/m.234067 type:complete len:222 (-) Transcript_83877:203-868(-)
MGLHYASQLLGILVVRLSLVALVALLHLDIWLSCEVADLDTAVHSSPLHQAHLGLDVVERPFHLCVVPLVLLELQRKLPELVATRDLVELPFLIHLLPHGSQLPGVVRQDALASAHRVRVRDPSLVAPTLQQLEVRHPQAVVLELHVDVLSRLAPCAMVLAVVALGRLHLVLRDVDARHGLAGLHASEHRLHVLAREQRQLGLRKGSQVVSGLEPTHLLLD